MLSTDRDLPGLSRLLNTSQILRDALGTRDYEAIRNAKWEYGASVLSAKEDLVQKAIVLPRRHADAMIDAVLAAESKELNGALEVILEDFKHKPDDVIAGWMHGRAASKRRKRASQALTSSILRPFDIWVKDGVLLKAKDGSLFIPLR